MKKVDVKRCINKVREKEEEATYKTKVKREIVYSKAIRF